MTLSVEPARRSFDRVMRPVERRTLTQKPGHDPEEREQLPGVRAVLSVERVDDAELPVREPVDLVVRSGIRVRDPVELLRRLDRERER
jgi:hypothetical protein